MNDTILIGFLRCFVLGPNYVDGVESLIMWMGCMGGSSIIYSSLKDLVLGRGTVLFGRLHLTVSCGLFGVRGIVGRLKMKRSQYRILRIYS